MQFNRKGFTIVELLVVIAIIGILIGIVSSVASSAMKNARTKRATVMCAALEQAIATYHVQKGEWPGPIESKASSMGNVIVEELSASEADSVFQEIVRLSVGNNASMPLIDTTGLFVAKSSRVKDNGCNDSHKYPERSDYCGNKGCVGGVDFAEAIKRGKHHMSISEMAFGYQGTEYGRFRRYKISYNGQTDTVKVYQ